MIAKLFSFWKQMNTKKRKQNFIIFQKIFISMSEKAIVMVVLDVKKMDKTDENNSFF